MKDFCEIVLLILAIPVHLFLDFIGAHKTAMKIQCWADKMAKIHLLKNLIGQHKDLYEYVKKVLGI